MAYDVISADSHIDIPFLDADLFVSNAPAKLRDKMPRVVDTDKGQQWMVEGRPLGFVAGAGFGLWEPYEPGVLTRLDRMADVGFFSDAEKGLLHPSDPKLRLADQDLDGVDAEVIYGLLGVAGTSDGGLMRGEGTEGYGIHDLEVLRTVYEIYNEWLAGFCKSSPGRLAGVASLSNHDPVLAATQLRHAAELGLKGAEINTATAVRPIYQDEWDVLWAAAAECEMPISFHTLGTSFRQPEGPGAEKYEWVANGLLLALFQLSGAEFLSSIIYSGACERHPNFKFVLGECGIGWIPYVLYRMDDEFDRMPELKLSLKPSEFWRRQGHSTFQIEPVTQEIVDRVGEDNIMWGSDYPHGDGVFPDSQQVIEEHMGKLDARVRKKILCDNAARLYRFE